MERPGEVVDVLEPRPARVTLAAVREAYPSWAPTYIELFGAADRASAEDRDRIAGWAGTVHGPVLDAGCGPGHWSAFLRDLGLDVRGVDATPAFVEHAGRTRPDIPFQVADLRALELADASCGGVLAWFSLIHLDPEAVPDLLGAFARALRPGGGLLVGFLAGDRLHAFDHRVVTAWAWPVPAVVAAVEACGLRVLRSDEREQPTGRRTASLTALRPA